MNNLFSFATKELSQDAFFCWAINWMAEESPNSKYYKLGKSVLDLFLGDNKCDEYDDVHVLRQKNRIDVLVLFKNKENDTKCALIIEDKVDTSEHSNQIQRYKEAVCSDETLGVDSEHVYVAFVKTGVMYDEDKRVNANTKVNLQNLCEVLTPYVEIINSQILNDYVDYHKEELEKRKAIDAVIKESHSEKWLEYMDGKSIFAEPYGQYAFLNAIFAERNIKKTIDISKNDKPVYEYINSIYNVNNYGDLCTQCYVWGSLYKDKYSTNNKYKEAHYLFWRIGSYVEKGKNVSKEPKYYIALRHYDDNASGIRASVEKQKSNKKADERKAAVYNTLSEKCNEIQKNYSAVITEVGGKSRYKESDLIYIPVENLKNIGDFEEVKRFLLGITTDVCSVADGIDYNKKSN